ncbi:MAG: hypothetical protein WBN11_04155, partial [Eudoraea sp.]
MKITLSFEYTSLAKPGILYLLFTVFMVTVSCGTDSLEDAEAIDGIESPIDSDNMEDPENENNSDNTNSLGAVVFEENFILEESRKFVNFILSSDEYNSFLEGEGEV